MAQIFSREDGNLSNSSRVTRERQYSDIDLTLDARIAPTYVDGDGDILRKTDAAAVKQAIKNLLLTNRYEKPYRPQFGGDLSGLLFELMDEVTGDEIISRVTNTIERYEPRAKILNLQVLASPNNNSVSLQIEFRIINTQVSDTLRVRLNEPFVAPTPIPPVTPVVVADEILLTEANDRILTFEGVLLRVDNLPQEDGALLTQTTLDQLLTQDERVLVINQS